MKQAERVAERDKTTLKDHRPKVSKMLARGSFIWILGLVYVANLQRAVHGSPPLDYLVYTSQLATASAGTQSVSSILPPIESIYAAVGPNKTTAGATPEQLAADNQQLQQLSARLLQLVGNSSHTHDNDKSDLEVSLLAWHLMERQSLVYMKNRIHTLKPFIAELLVEAQISSACSEALGMWLDELTDLKYWATLMWNAWGQTPPTGLFEGSFSDLGSYPSCMAVPDNEIIGEAQYCMLDFQPIIPTRPRFHSIYKRVLDVDTRTGRLTAGDFESAGDRITSRHSAHEFPSIRYSRNRDDQMTRFDRQNSSSVTSKYIKRTIVQPNIEGTSDLSVDGEIGKRNLTLKAEALIALAQKAQYFYYVKFRLGSCFPTKCSTADVQKIAQAAGRRAILQANQVNCMTKEPTRFNSYQLFAIVVLSSLASIAVVGTLVDLLGFKADRNDSSSLVSWLLPFSMWTNARRLFDSDTAGTQASLECVHGLRFLSMLWVIYGHTILYIEYQAFTHFFEVVETRIPSFLLLPTLNANFSVDTFFVISGILTTYVTWDYTKGDVRKFNRFAFAISRYIRLTPQFGIVILFFFLLPLFGNGAIYRQMSEAEAKLCYDGWLTNLLYMQSYTGSAKICIDPSWWLSIEMSFHLMSMFLMVYILKDAKTGIVVNLLAAAALTIWGAVIHYTHGFPIQYLPSIPQRYEIHTEETNLFFHRPYPHAASYFIGVVLGYLLANKSIKKLTQAQVYQGWFVCAAGLITCLWGTYWWNLGAPYTQLQATLFYHLCQVLWPISIAWIILACSLGHGGIVNSILSAPCFVPLGRVTYMTYLSHTLVILNHAGSMNIPVEPSVELFIYFFIAGAFLSLLLGIVLTVVYESPILNLQKKLFAFMIGKFGPSDNKRSLNELPTTIIIEEKGACSAANARLLGTKVAIDHNEAKA